MLSSPPSPLSCNVRLDAQRVQTTTIVDGSRLDRRRSRASTSADSRAHRVEDYRRTTKRRAEARYSKAQGHRRRLVVVVSLKLRSLVGSGGKMVVVVDDESRRRSIDDREQRALVVRQLVDSSPRDERATSQCRRRRRWRQLESRVAHRRRLSSRVRRRGLVSRRRSAVAGAPKLAVTCETTRKSDGAPSVVGR